MNYKWYRNSSDMLQQKYCCMLDYIMHCTSPHDVECSKEELLSTNIKLNLYPTKFKISIQYTQILNNN